jgi:predicted P-loop ATPase
MNSNDEKKIPGSLKVNRDTPKDIFDGKGKIKQAVDFLNEHYIIHIPNNDPAKVTVECRDKSRYSESPTIEDVYLHFIEENDFSISMTVLRMIIRSRNYIRPFDPVKDYLDSIRKKYAGESHIDLLCSFLKFREFNPELPNCSQERAVRLIKKWMVATVAQWIDNVPNPVMLTFIQRGEGYGKTSLVNHIIPEALKEYAVKASNNDARFDLEDAYTRHPFVIHDELIGITKGSIDTWKSVMTSKHLLTRRRGEEIAINRPRIGVALGTTNRNQENGGFIRNNNFGSRRFGCIELDHIAWREYIKVVDVDQMWAEALMLYESSGLSFEFERDKDFNDFDAYNERYFVETVSFKYVSLYFAHPGEGEEAEWMNASEILQDIRKYRLVNRDDLFSVNVRELGIALTSLGFECKTVRKEGHLPFKRYHVKRLYDNT